jgi:hypothetical protein
MLIRFFFFALSALAIATSGYAQAPVPSKDSPPTTLIRQLTPSQRIVAAKTRIGPPSESPSPSTTVPTSQPNAGQPLPDQDTVVRLQIYLDEHSFGPGKIDGRWGEFIGKALQRFQVAQGQPPSGQINSALEQELRKISPVYTTYTFTEADLHWIGNVPS